MKKSFLFYDLETSGISAPDQRIMQFAAQRTDAEFNPIEKPVNLTVRLADDILPEPMAIITTGITPQSTQDGISERELVNILDKEVFTPGTTIMGYNTMRFDNRFIQFLMWRSFSDPYAWGYKQQRSLWDIIDPLRMCRALRPEGIEWPERDGKPSTTLEGMTKANGIDQTGAHDALVDVNATIAVAQLLRSKQPQLMNHLLGIAPKSQVQKLLDPRGAQPIVHSSGNISPEFLQTSVFLPLSTHPSTPNKVICWDLRYDPSDFASINEKDISDLLFTSAEELESSGRQRLPIKTISTNKSPALAPLGVLDEASQKRISLSIDDVQKNLKNIEKINGLLPAIIEALDKPWPKKDNSPPETMLYDGFISDSDRIKSDELLRASKDKITEFDPGFDDQRLQKMLPHYLVRNFPDAAPDSARKSWDLYRHEYALSPEKVQDFISALEEAKAGGADDFIIDELGLWLQSIAP